MKVTVRGPARWLRQLTCLAPVEYFFCSPNILSPYFSQINDFFLRKIIFLVGLNYTVGYFLGDKSDINNNNILLVFPHRDGIT